MSVQQTIEAIRAAGKGELIRITDREFISTHQLKKELNELCDSHERLRQAVEHYADEANWSRDAYFGQLLDYTGSNDGPSVAQAALKQTEPEQEE